MSKAKPTAANGSVSANVSTFERQKMSALSTHRYQIGTLISCSAKLSSASGTSATGQLMSR
jgi:hypothetical protein